MAERTKCRATGSLSSDADLTTRQAGTQASQKPGGSNRRQRRAALGAVAAAVFSACGVARTGLSATIYFDPNGTAAGGTYTGTWDNVTPIWSTNVAGTAPTTWVPGSDAYFNAETGTGSLTENIVVSGNQTANSLQLNYGTNNFTGLAGATLSLGAGGILMTGNSSYVGNMTFASSIPILLTTNQIWNFGVGSGLNHTPTFNDAISGNSAAGATTILYMAPFGGDLPGATGATVGGQFQDGTAGGNLALDVAGSGVLTVTGTGTYTGGTNIERGVLNLGSSANTGNLGAGSVNLDAGELALNTTANYTAANYTTSNGFLVGPRAGLVISNVSIIPGTSGTSAITGSPTVTLPIDPNSSGFFGFGGLNGLQMTAVINLADLGNGSMFFGSYGGSGGGIANAGTYTAASIGAGAGNVYRLGAGEGALKFSSNNVLTNTTVGTLTTDSVIIGEPLSTVAGTLGIGTVILNAAGNGSTNSYSGGTTVNLGSTLEAGANTGTPTGSPMGTGSITLLGKIQADGSTTANVILKTPDIDFSSDASIIGNITNTAAFAGIQTISLSGEGTVGLTRVNQGILQISTGGGSFNVIGTNTKILVANNAPATTAIDGGSNTMIAPYFLDASGNFLTYGSTGFVDATAGPATIGASTNTNDYVKTAAADSTAATKTIYALDANGTVTDSSGGPVSLTIASGGLTLLSGNVGSMTAANNVNLVFGTGGTGAEALIYNGGASTIYGTITGNSGLTKSGAGTLTLNPYAAGAATVNSFTGTVTVNAGTLSPSEDGALGATTNSVLLNGGTLNFPNSYTLVGTRTLQIGAAGGFINGSGKTATIASYVTTGGLGTSAAFLDINDGITAGTVALSDASNDFTAPIFVEGATTLSIAADTDLGNAANSVTLNGLIGGTAINTYAPTLQATASIATARNITLSGVGAQIDTTANTFTLNGIVSGDASLTKFGTGTLVLAGTNTYGGETIISAGILQIGTGTTSGQLGTGSVTSPGPILFDRSNSYSVADIINGAGSLTQEGTGILKLAASNGYTGTTTLAAGEVNLGVAQGVTTGPLGNPATPANSIILNGGYLQYSSANQYDYSPRFSTAASQQYNIDTNGQSVSFATALNSSSGSLSKIGSGTLTLPTSSTYSGITAISGGTLDVTGAIGSSGTINVTATSIPSALILDGASAISSAAPITLTGATSNLIVNNTQTLASIASAGTATFTAGTSIVGQGSGVGTGTSGTLTTGGISGAGTLTVSGTASLYASHITQSLLTIGSASTVTIADSAAPGNTSATSVLTDIANSGTLDLNNNDLIVLDTTQYTTVRASIENAYDGGAWDQPGITSSSARANAGAYGLGYAQASSIGSTSFDGQTFTDAVLVKYTLLGDTQLRGTVGIGDYDTVLSNYGTAQDWSGGDFHYGGVVGIGDYDDVLTNYGAHASGNLTVGPTLTRSISPAVSINPDLAKTDLKLEVNTTTGDVYLLATASAAFTGYTISDPTAHLLGGSTSPDPDKLLSVAAGNGGNTNVYETSGTYVDWFKITETASQVAEGQQQNGFGTHSSRDDTINIPAGGTIDFGEIYNTAAAQQDLTFDFAEAGTEPTNGPTYYGAEVDYITTPEPGSPLLLTFAAVGALVRRRRKNIGS
jgi:autotransporter-associated beta strand protein